MKRVLVIAPGRGSYGPSELGTMARVARESERAEAATGEVTAAIDGARAERGLGPVRAFDEGEFRGSHLAAENASALILACSLIDARLVPDTVTIAGVLGNSLGFYTALGISGALSLEDTARLVVTMSALQAKHGQGAQVLYPTVDEDWHPVPERRDAVARALREHEGSAFPSVHLGGFEVLSVRDASAVALPPVRHGGRDFPIVLEGHQGYHSPLVEEVAARAPAELAHLRFRMPRIPLICGFGAILSPYSTDAKGLAAYALEHQVRNPFDFTRALRVGLRELAPDALVLLGPGESIGGAIGQVLVEERFQGIDSKAAFIARQRSDPILHALGRKDQRKAFLAGAAP